MSVFLEAVPIPGQEAIFEGIKEAIYFFLNKIIDVILQFIDSISSLFNFFLGLGEDGGLLVSIFENPTITRSYLYISIMAFILMLLFSIFAIIKQDYFDDEGPRSKAPIIKKLFLGFFLFIVIAPVTTLILKFVSLITEGVYTVFSTSNPISIKEIIAKPIMEPALFEGQNILLVVLLSSVFVGWNLLSMVLDLIKRIFNIMVLYVMAPFEIAKMVSDDGVRFKKWKDKALSQIVSIVGIVASFSVFGVVVSIIGNMEFTGGGESTGTILFSEQYLYMAILLMGGSLVVKDTSKMISELSGSNNIFKTTTLQSYVSTYNENKASGDLKSANKTTPKSFIRTTIQTAKRTVSFNPGGSKKQISGASSFGLDSKNQDINRENRFSGSQQTSQSLSSNKNTGVKLQERISFNTSGNRSLQSTYQSGSSYTGNQRLVSSVLKDGYDVPNLSSQSLDIGEDYAVKTNTQNYNEVSTNFASNLKSAGSDGVNKIVVEYVEAANKENRSIQKEMKKKESDISPIKKDFNPSQRKELDTVSTNYKKAQSDYSKTTSKIGTLATTPDVRTSDLLRIKEKADQQRQRLVDASNKAFQFYKNSKGGK